MVVEDDSRFARFTTYLRDLDRLCWGGRIKPAWSPDGSVAGFVAGPPDELRAWRVDLRTGDKTPLVDVDRARLAIAEATGRTPPGQGLPFPGFTFLSAEKIGFEVGATALALDLNSYQAAEVGRAGAKPGTYLRWSRLTNPREELEVPSPDGTYFLSTIDHDIVARSAYDGATVRLTADGTTDHQWRFDAPYRVPPAPGDSALGDSGSGVCWSPDGRKVAAYTVDFQGVYRAPRVHYRKAGDEVVVRPRARAGGILERTTLHVLDLYGPAPVELDLGDTADTYPVVAAWSPDSTALLVVSISRDCRQATVLEADAVTGRTRVLFVESGRSFVRHHHDFYFPPGGEPELLWLTPDGQHIIWASERSGWRHFYLYDRDGTLVRQLTDGPWPVAKAVAVRDGHLYFTGHRDQDRPYDLHFYRVRLDGGHVQPLTEAPGVHDVALAPSGTAFLDTFSTVARPPVVEVRTAEGRRLAEVSRADISRLEATGYLPPEEFTVTAADGRTRLLGVMFKPHDFDPAGTYPVIEYVYGGPQTTIVPHGFVEGNPDGFGAVAAQALAQLGYVTLMVDARGTPGRSKAFHDASYLRWANVLADDHATTIGQLAARHPFIDATRVGVIGHSWGGYAAFRCLADRPDIYRAAVCSAPGFDPYYGVLCEPYLDLPQRNPDGYAFADAIPLASKIRGPVMIAAGTADHVTWTDAIKMSEALIRDGKPHEFVVLPEQYHSYDNLHDDYFWRKAGAFLARHLAVSPENGQ